MDNATAALARMNMILHDCPTAEIWQDNTLASPHFKDDKTARSRPSTSSSPIRRSRSKRGAPASIPADDEFKRFELGVPPPKNGDYAFLLHILARSRAPAKARCILPHGVLFRGSAEAVIRREIVQRGYIKGIIGLPAESLLRHRHPACIVVLDKENADARKGIFMIDASKGFIKDGNKNRLRAQDIHKIVDIFTRQVEDPALLAHGAARGDQRPEERLQPQPPALHRQHRAGGPAGHRRPPARRHPGPRHRCARPLLAGLPGVRAALFEKADRPGYSQLKVAVGEIKAAIFGHASSPPSIESRHQALRASGQKANAPRLKGIGQDDNPKALIETLSEDLLATFRQRRCSTPTTSISTSWTTGPRPCRTIVYLIVERRLERGRQARELISRRQGQEDRRRSQTSPSASRSSSPT